VESAVADFCAVAAREFGRVGAEFAHCHAFKRFVDRLAESCGQFHAGSVARIERRGNARRLPNAVIPAELLLQ
jgi:hypothetical protein